MNWDAAQVEASKDPDFWRRFFADRPDALYKILGDVYEITKAHDGQNARSGRRSKTGAGTLDEIWNLLSAEPSNLPFGEAFKKAAGDRSIRSIAPAVPLHFSQLASLVAGRRRLVDYNDMRGSMNLIERIAKPLRVHPSYFIEWRELYVLVAVREALRSGSADLSHLI